ncbi:MAG TPA: oxygenase MpaB family protein [Acidimicrobiales bacterium]
MSLSDPQTAQPLGPESLTWRLGLPRTALLLAGRALLLQTMHPVVGAGVRDHSDYRTDPWGRLERTITSLQIQMFGGEESVAEAARLREMHKAIKGVGFDGDRYRALDPEAYAWVHLSNFDTMLSFNRWFARKLSAGEQYAAYEEWKQSGRVLGIRETYLPGDIDDFRAYVDTMMATTLEANETALHLVNTLRLDDIGSPPWRSFPEPLWRSLRPAGRMLLYDTTVGTLPRVLRQKMGLRWSTADHRRLQSFALVVRTAARTTPDRFLQYPMGYQAQQAARRVTTLVA